MVDAAAMSTALEPEIVDILRAWHGALEFERMTREPLHSPDSATLAPIERVTIQTPDGTCAYVVKRIRPLGDWLARATDDRMMREHQVARSGVFARMPAGVASATLATTEIAGGAAIIMRDVTSGLIGSGDALLTPQQLRISIAGLVRMHEAFLGIAPELSEAFGYNRMETWLTPLSPATARREELQPERDPFTPLIDPGWAAFAELAPEAWEIVGTLLEDPSPLAAIIRTMPATLVHGDVKAANFAVEDGTLVLFDWSTTTAGPGALDLAWYLCMNAHKLPCSKTEVIELYRAERARTGILPATGAEWERELALALLTSPMRLGWLRAYSAKHGTGERAERDRREIAYWAERALAARDLLLDAPGDAFDLKLWS